MRLTDGFLNEDPGEKPKGEVEIDDQAQINNITEYWPMLETHGDSTRGFIGVGSAIGESGVVVTPKGLETFGGSGDLAGLGRGFFNNLFDGADSCRISMGFTFKVIDGSNDDNNTLIGCYVNGNSNCILIKIGTDGTILVGGRSEGGDGFQSVTSTNAVTAGIKYHLDARYDYVGDNITFFVNGVEWANGSVTFDSSQYTAGSPNRDDALAGDYNTNRECDAFIHYVVWQKNTVNPPDIYKYPYQFLRPEVPLSSFTPAAVVADGPEHLIIRRKFQGTRPRNESLLYH